MMLKGFSRSLLTLSFISTLLMVASAVSAASACKGLDENTCKQSPSCSWINSYTTKNGNTVSAYCRSAGKQQGLNQKQKKDSVTEVPGRADSGTGRTTADLEERNG